MELLALAGRVSLNGTPMTKKSAQLRVGDELELKPPPGTDQPGKRIRLAAISNTLKGRFLVSFVDPQIPPTRSP